IWDNQHWDVLLNDYRTQLLNNRFSVSKKLQPFIGDFGLIYFGNETITRSLNISGNYMEVKLMEQDGYNFLVRSVDQLIQLFHHTSTTIDAKKLLASSYDCNAANDST